MALLIAGVWGVYAIEQGKGRTPQTVTMSRIPLKVGQWEGKDIPVEQKVYEILETKDVLVREYKDPEGDSVYLSIVYSQSNRGSFHPPEICYLGGGVKLLNKGVENIAVNDGNVLETNILEMDGPVGVMKAWYWFAAGTRFVQSYYKQQIYLLRDAFSGRATQGALIRVSGKIVNSRIEHKIKGFIRDMLPYLEVFFRKT